MVDGFVIFVNLNMLGDNMILFTITDIDTINYFFSIFLNLAFVIVPLFGALALTRH